MAENKLFTIYSIALLIAIYLCSTIVLFWGESGKILFFEIGALTLPSIGLFAVICIFAVWKRKYFFVFLVFILLAFPSPIDDIFPSVIVSNADDRKQIMFSFITRIDIYLILGILLGLYEQRFRLKTINFGLVLKTFLVLFSCVFFVNIFKSEDVWDFNLLLAHSFHLRYLFLFLILLQLYDIKKYEKELAVGFCLSLFFLLIEAYANTHLKGAGRLLSGSLSLNTFANITTAIALYITFLLKDGQIKQVLGIGALAVAFVIIVASGTRGAILAYALSYLLIILVKDRKKLVMNILKVASGIVLIAFAYYFTSSQGYIPKRFSYEEISNKVDLNFEKSGLTKVIDVRYSEETTSIRSRLILFETSINMIDDNPFSGVGVGRWNRNKKVYLKDGSIAKVLLDSHNDYLALMSQYGIALGLLFAWLVFFYPFAMHKKIRHKDDGPLVYLYVLNFTMGIAAFSNAGFFKHQVSALLLLSLCITLKLRYENATI
ncbi:MAG: O-antigen ligase family protein [Pricia sp.]